MSTLYVSMQCLRGKLTCCDCIDSKLRTCINITTDEEIRSTLYLICNLISNKSRSSKFNVLILQQIAPYRSLTYCKDHSIALKCDCLILIILRIKSTLGIKYLCTLLKDNAGNLAVSNKYFLRTPATLNGYAVFSSLTNLFVRCRHRTFRLQAKLCYF